MKPLLLPILSTTFLIYFGSLPCKGGGRATSVPVVVSVEADKITVQNGIHAGMKVTGHESNEALSKNPVNVRTYTVNRFTEITINGHKMQLSDVKKGMRVRVTQGIDPHVAASVVATTETSVLQPAHP